MWVLVLIIAWNSPSITTIPGSYSTEEKCREAAKVYTDAQKLFTNHSAFCIPAPDDIVYE